MSITATVSYYANKIYEYRKEGQELKKILAERSKNQELEERKERIAVMTSSKISNLRSPKTINLI